MIEQNKMFWRQRSGRQNVKGCLIVLMFRAEYEIGIKLCCNCFGASPDIEFWLQGVDGWVMGMNGLEKSDLCLVTHQRPDANANTDVTTFNLHLMLESILLAIFYDRK